MGLGRDSGGPEAPPEAISSAAILDALPANVALLDPNGDIIAVNAAWGRFARGTAAETVGVNYLRVCDEAEGPIADEAKRAAVGLRAVLAGASREFSFEYPLTPPDGRRWFRMLVTPLKSGGAVVMHVDITRERAAEEALREREALVRIAGRVARLGGWILTVPGFVETWSDETAAIHDEPAGYSPPDVAAGLRYYPAAHRDALRRAFQACIVDGAPVDLEVPIVTAKGRHGWVRVIGEAVRDAAGAVTHVQGAFQDVTDQHAAAEQIRGLGERLLSTVESMPEGFCTIDADERFTYVNAEAERLLERPRAELLGRSVRAEFARAPGVPFEGAIRAAVAVGERRLFEAYYPPLGRWFEVSLSPSRGSLAVYFRDVTERHRDQEALLEQTRRRREIEAQFLRAQRLDSLGALAGGIAHDLNNTLAPLLLTVSVLRDGERDPRRREDLATIESCARRGANMVRQLLTFARGSEGGRTRTDLGAVAHDVERIVRDTFPKDISFALSAASDRGTVSADLTQMHQLLTNLCVNARDAMPNGGTLTVAVERVVLDETDAATNVGARPGPYVLLRVEDTGTGMTAAVLDRVFEPFFTTKALGKGTGLGLPTAHAIVRDHGGFVRVASEVGGGTRFRVYLPADDTTDDREEATSAESALPRGDNELVLVVDDEEAIRATARRTLERFGYRVLVAADGAEAVALYAGRRDEIALVLTDMAMPVLDGPATVEALKALNPRVRVVGSSGFAAPESLARVADAGVQHFVAKPYTGASLLRVIREALTGAG